MVAHDVNPILAYLDRVDLPRPTAAPCRDARRGHHHRDAEPAVRDADRGAAHSDGRLVVVGQPEAPPHSDRHTAHDDAARCAARCRAAPSTWNLARRRRRAVAVTRSWSTPSGPARSSPSWPALIGWFMVLRRQTFAGHTLAVVGFPGAAGAVLLGISATVRATSRSAVAAALVIARRLPAAAAGGYSEESAVIGTVQAFALACGFLFVTLYDGFLERRQRPAVRQLPRHHRRPGRRARRWSRSLVLAVLAVDRPARCCSPRSTPTSRRAAACRCGCCRSAFLVLLGVAAAEASQITGSLLVFALLVLPAATAQRLTARPVVSLALAVAVGAGGHLGRAGRRLLLAVPDRLLLTHASASPCYLAPTRAGVRGAARGHGRRRR